MSWTIVASAVFLLLVSQSGVLAVDLRMLKKNCLAVTSPRDRSAVSGEFTLIENSIQGTSPKNAKKVIRQRLANTRWGTPQRAVACLVSAWYGVDYTRSRDYLLNCFFWSGREGDPVPYCWAEGTVVLLYQLYERNHDFRLLHDLVTGFGDDSGILTEVRSSACAKHPRGMLHVASISKAGLTRVRMLVQHNPDDPKAAAILRTYARRVAADHSDPLSDIAQRVLAVRAAK